MTDTATQPAAGQKYAWATNGAKGSTSWVCPKCGARSCVTVDTRPSEAGVRRRRLCLGCRTLATTYEISAEKIVRHADLLKIRRALTDSLDLVNAAIAASGGEPQ